MDETGQVDPEIFCSVCGSYAHEFLSRYPACGTPKRTTLSQQLAENPGPRPPTADPEMIQLLRSNDRLFRSQVETAADGVNRQAAKLTYRYLGGLPGFSGGVEVRLQISPDRCTLVGVRGGPLASLAGHQVLCVSAQARDSQLDNWYGIFVGNAGAFFAPTIHGGALTVTFASAGEILQFSLGDRTGILASHGSPEFYQVLAMEIGGWATASVLPRLLQVGARAYARELGLPASPTTSDAAPPALS